MQIKLKHILLTFINILKVCGFYIFGIIVIKVLINLFFLNYFSYMIFLSSHGHVRQSLSPLRIFYFKYNK